MYKRQVIHDSEEMVKKRIPDFDINNIPLDDKETFDMLTKGQTDGVFQLESQGMRQVISRLVPESVEDIIAVISLYRPGPMDFIPQYIENRHHPDKITDRTPMLKDILDAVSYTHLDVYKRQHTYRRLHNTAQFLYGLPYL